MGQQETTTSYLAAAGGALRRIVVLMTVVALMAVMLAMSVGPAFAGGDKGNHAIQTACSHSGGKAFSGGPGEGSCRL